MIDWSKLKIKNKFNTKDWKFRNIKIESSLIKWSNAFLILYKINELYKKAKYT